MRLFSLGLGLLLSAATAQAQTYRFQTGTATSTAFAFGNTVARHTQQLYRPGEILDSTLASVTVNKIYFQCGPNFGSQDSDVDTVHIRMGSTTLRSFEKVQIIKNRFVRNSQMQEVFFNSNYQVPANTDGTWFSIDLTNPFTLDPSKSTVVDIQFTGNNSNPSYSVNGVGRFSTNQRTYAGALTDSLGSQSSSTLPYFGIDIVTATAPRKVLAMQSYPNPAQDRIMLGLPNPTEATVCLIGTDGRRVELGTQSGWASWELPKGLATGLYRIVARQSGLEYSSTLAVQ